MAFYRAYNTKAKAKVAAKDLREPKNAYKAIHAYPISVTIGRVKRFYSDGRPAWCVYINKRKESRVYR